jgi:hypothetical protein
MHKFQNNTGTPLTPLEDKPLSEMPTVALILGEPKQKGQVIGKLINLESKSEVKKVPLLNGTMITFSGNI